ncbi:hypothetical protein E2C01_057976 [Portunus trituberculatus]|uniref:Uncharacterized protein n=1 Tax=Portunus trituberculatus TaxID=210409 RepID=A0A5B7H1T3_PORTR|nr:hypothetical protein [Portunus trituberculatus]
MYVNKVVVDSDPSIMESFRVMSRHNPPIRARGTARLTVRAQVSTGESTGAPGTCTSSCPARRTRTREKSIRNKNGE